MAPSLLQFDPRRIRSWIYRIPLCTRILLAVIVALWAASIPLTWLRDWGSLVPEKVGLATMYRLNTYPLIHMGFIHMLFNLLALAPLLERFEAEHGTLVTLSLFTGPFGLLPGGIYIGIERLLLRSNTAIQGASIWVFLLLASEAMKTYKAHPYFSLGDVKIPTWTTPLVIILFVSFLVPHTSLIGHLCGAAIGYLCASTLPLLLMPLVSILHYDCAFLVPPERILRFIEGKLNLLGRLPHYVSIDQKTYGRYGVLPTTTTPPHAAPTLSGPDGGVPLSYIGSSQRLGT
ncbi:hypothetical protein B0A49_01971 [Cryomyces minteri]|uniref:rhomboid protease n=1 Tax=Cryomyces minteri TaxID=331657 RepID=A0A4U0X7Z4_9PEZI|nr:hypothetical protein B0A49_04071 [Cryomyces minteri]TKA73018.1 hypothetical protein B0A49_01971 [Cryomyces minteri]